VVANQLVLGIEEQIVSPDAASRQRHTRMATNPINFARLHRGTWMLSLEMEGRRTRLVIAVVCGRPSRCRTRKGAQQASGTKSHMRLVAGHPRAVQVCDLLIVARTACASGEESEGEKERCESHKRAMWPDTWAVINSEA